MFETVFAVFGTYWRDMVYVTTSFLLLLVRHLLLEAMHLLLLDMVYVFNSSNLK